MQQQPPAQEPGLPRSLWALAARMQLAANRLRRCFILLPRAASEE